MGQFLSATANPLALGAPDVYIRKILPPGVIEAQPGDVFATPGTAPWGPMDVPILCGSPDETYQRFGGITAAGFTDKYDLCSAAQRAFQQAGTPATLQGWLLRVGINAAKALYTLQDLTAPTALDGAKANAYHFGTRGNEISMKIEEGSVDDFFSVKVLPFGGVRVEDFPNIDGSMVVDTNGDETVTVGGTVTALDHVQLTITDQNLPGGAQTLHAYANGRQTATVAGVPVEGDNISVTVISTSLSGGQETIPVTVGAGPTTATVATQIADAINANTELTDAGISAAAVAAVVTITYPGSLNAVTFARQSSAGATITLAATTTSSTQTTIAAALVAAINANTALDDVGITATNLANVVTVVSESDRATTYSRVNSANTTLTLAGVAAEEHSVFWENLETAINEGLSGIRGPSEYIVISDVSTTAGQPALGTFTLSGGTDGRAGVTDAEMVGENLAEEPTGMWAFATEDVSPVPSVLFFPSLTDTSVFPEVEVFCDQNGVLGMLALPVDAVYGTEAVTAKKALGIVSENICFGMNWIYWRDPVNDKPRLVDPCAHMAGAIAALSPEQSPLNKPVKGIIGTVRQNKSQGNRRFTRAEIGLVQQNGILLITNGVPGGKYWGFRTGKNASPNPVLAPVETTRMYNYLGHNLIIGLGKYIGELQGTDVNDDVRAQIKHDADDLLQKLADLKKIDNFETICDRANNPDPQVADHMVFINVNVRTKSAIYELVVNLQVGTTVEIKVKSITPVQQAA